MNVIIQKMDSLYLRQVRERGEGEREGEIQPGRQTEKDVLGREKC